MTWEIWLIGVLGILCLTLCYLIFILNKKSKELSKENIVLDETNEQDYRRDFVANVSHELRTPVSIIKGFSETLLEDFENIKEKKRKDFLEKINRNANRLHSLIEDLMLLAQFDGNPHSLKLQTVELTTTIREVVEECKSRWNPQELKVLLDLPNFEVPITVDPQKMILAPYHPDLPEMRNTYAKYSSAISKMDSLVGQAVENLKNDNLYEDTIIVYNSDHGGVLARSKRFLYSSGIHCPLIVRIPEKWKHLYPKGKKPGSTIDRIVSFIDMPKTWLSLTGAKVTKNFQGRIFLGPDTEPEPRYHFSWRERADERFDNVRVVRDEQFAYHKNYAPFAPNGQYLAYMHNMKATGAWEKHHQAGKTNKITGRFFEPRLSEEFYDNFKDFHNIDNRIEDPLHQSKIEELKKELRRQQLKYFDSGLMPEEMRKRITSEKKTTVYAFVRDPKLYPLAKYLDYADLALTRKKKNLSTLTQGLLDSDPVMRYWSVIGLLLLEKKAKSAIPELKNVLGDRDEIPAFAAWAIYKAGEKAFAEKWMLEAITHNPGNKTLANIFDWMGKESFSILAQIPEDKLSKRGLLKDVVNRYKTRVLH